MVTTLSETSYAKCGRYGPQTNLKKRSDVLSDEMFMRNGKRVIEIFQCWDCGSPQPDSQTLCNMCGSMYLATKTYYVEMKKKTNKKATPKKLESLGEIKYCVSQIKKEFTRTTLQPIHHCVQQFCEHPIDKIAEMTEKFCEEALFVRSGVEDDFASEEEYDDGQFVFDGKDLSKTHLLDDMFVQANEIIVESGLRQNLSLLGDVYDRFRSTIDHDFATLEQIQSWYSISYRTRLDSIFQRGTESGQKYSQQNTDILGVIEGVAMTFYYTYRFYCPKKRSKEKTPMLNMRTALEVSVLALKLVGGVSFLSLSKDVVKNIKRKISDLLSDQEVQSFEVDMETLKSFIESYDAIKNSAFVKKIYKLCLYLISLSVFKKFGIDFDSLGYTAFEREAMKRKYYLNGDFIHCLFDTVIFLFERGAECMKTGSFQPFMHTSKSYMEYSVLAEKLKRQSQLLHNPEAHGFSESSFRAELDKAIERGENICKFALNLHGADKKMLRNLTNELHLIRCDLCTRAAAREDRLPPFSLLVYGGSGIGKSTIKDLLYYHYGKVMKLDVDKSFCYTRNPVAKFWDGFTTSQWCIILDDVAFMHPNKAASGDPSCMEFLQIINAVPFVPDQADLGNKGRTPLRSKLCIATTNTKHLNAHHYFSFPSAAQRRFPFIIEPSVLASYRSEDGMLDTSLCSTLAGTYPDFWHWKVYKVTPSDKGLAKQTVILETDSVNEFIKWYTQAIFEFNTNQEKVKSSVDAMKNISLCNACYLPTQNCECEIQSGVYDWMCLSMFLHWFHLFLYYVIYNRCSKTFDFFMSYWSKYNRIKSEVLYRIPKKMMVSLNTIRMSHIGTKIERELRPHQFKLLAGTCSLLFIFYKIYKNMQTQSSEGKAPKPKERERENVWFNPDMELSSFDMTNQSTSANSLTRTEFCDLVEREIVSLEVHTERETFIPGKAFCLKGSIYVTNSHIIPKFEEYARLKIIYQQTRDGVTGNISIMLYNRDILMRDETRDIVVFQILSVPPKKGLYKYLPKKFITPRLNGFLMTRLPDGSVSTKVVNRLRVVPMGSRKNMEKFKHDMVSGILKGNPTQCGDCGSVLVAQSDIGYMIVGIHAILQVCSNEVFSVSLAQEMFDRIFQKIDIQVQSGDGPNLTSQMGDRCLTSLSEKSVLRYISRGTAQVYGSFTGFRRSSKSSVELTPMVNFLDRYGYKIHYGPPVMNGWKPWRIAAEDMLNPILDINSDILIKCKNAFLDDIVFQLNRVENAFDDLHVYDDFTAINGAAGVAYVDKLNRKSSAGNPWKKSKKYFLIPIDPQEGLNDPVEATPEIMTRVGSIIAKYHSGERTYPNFCAHLKDEAVSFKKIRKGKTRVFAGAPMDWSIVVRKYLLAMIRLMQNNRYAFEIATGTVAQSHEWGEMYAYITKHGCDRIVAGDYASFDKRMSPKFICAAYDIIIELCRMSGNYDNDDIRVLEGIKIDTAYPIIDYNGDLIQFYGSNPSGHPLTVVINSLVNSLYMRYAYFVLNPDKEVSSFRSRVSLMTYGDDNIMSVSQKASWYNHTNISRIFETLDIKYTMADKEAESIPFINIKDASFLKRSWRFDTDVENFLAPLDHSSIEKSLMVWVRSHTISSEEQCIEVIGSAVREYFFYGRSMYDKKVEMLQKLVVELNLQDWVKESTFPSFDFLVGIFWENSSRLGCSPDECKKSISRLVTDQSLIDSFEEIGSVESGHIPTWAFPKIPIKGWLGWSQN